MQTSALRKFLTGRVLEFAWREWAQVGVLAEPQTLSPWAEDPEALLLLSFQIGRDDPRLFDEVLDWMIVSIAQVSVQRLRNQSASEADNRLTEAVLGWLAANGARVRSSSPPKSRAAERLFPRLRAPSRTDPIFARYGFLRSPVKRSGKSRSPDLALPINFAFRLRHVFGVGTRAEVMRFLLSAAGTSPPPSRPFFTVLAIAEAAGFSKRNVQETLNALAEADAIGHIVRGNEHLYSIDVDKWRALLPTEHDRYPLYRDWTDVFVALRELHGWLSDPEVDKLTPYMRSSEARRKMDEIRSSLHHAGMPISERPVPPGGDYWSVFVDQVQQIVNLISSPLPW